MRYSLRYPSTTPRYSNPAPRTAASRVMPQAYSAPSTGFGNQSVNTSATSRSFNSFGDTDTPDFPYDDPGMPKQLDISNLIYSPTAGGRANRNYSGFKGGFGGNPNNNPVASNFYNYIGSLFNQRMAPALNPLNQLSGNRPPIGSGYNQQLGSLFNNTVKQAGFGLDPSGSVGNLLNG